jgi:YegS/Rv2252/BmrU family lipid kinase
MRSTRGRIIRDTIGILKSQGMNVRALETHGPGTATQIARDALLTDPDLILVAGGDGTINEVANGMAFSHVPLGILPAGTANVLAVELGLGRKMDAAARMIPQCAPERISIGQVHNALGSRYFLMMAGVGLDAHIVYELNPRLKMSLGKIAYWLAGFARVGKPVAQFDAVVNGTTQRCGFLLASRVKNYGGDLTIAANASLLEHDFEVVVMQGRNAARYLLYFVGVLTGTLARVRGATLDRAHRLEVRSPEDNGVYIQVDGEFAGRLPARIEIVESALTLLVPADARQRLGVKVTEALLPAAG